MAHMETVESLKKDALSLGYSDPNDIHKYVIEQQIVSRDERKAQRDLEGKIADNKRAEAEAKARETEAQLELARIRGFVPNSREISTLKVPSVKLPLYKDGDDISGFITRFEKMATLLHIPNDEWVVHFSSVLTGKALEKYVMLPISVTDNYQNLKREILLGFNRTPESYRTDFRNLRVEVDETFVQFVAKLRRTLELWVDSSNIARTYDGLVNFMLVDQFLAAVSPELRMFLKESGQFELEDLIRRSDSWTAAHKASFNPKMVKKTVFVKENQKSERDVRYSGGKSVPPPFQRDSSRVQCYHCREYGHTKPSCPILKNIPVKKDIIQNIELDDLSPEEGSSDEQEIKIQFCFEDDQPRKYLMCGTINGQQVSTIWRDSGCSSVLVSNNVLPNLDTSMCNFKTVYDYLGRANKFPVTKIHLNCPLYTGMVEAIVAPLKFCSVLLGNIPGVKDKYLPASNELLKPTDLENEIPVQNVKTRAKSVASVHPLKIPPIDGLHLLPEQFSSLQQSCSSLNECRKFVENGAISSTKLRDFKFIEANGLLYRQCMKSRCPNEVNQLALIVPKDCRDIVLRTAHESVLSGHFSFKKTELKIREDFFWPGMSRDVQIFCRSCDLCQRMSPKGKVPRAHMIKMPIISEPFYRVSIDIVGPLSPPTSEGHKYILTLIDNATSFPEAVPLRNIDTISVSEALLGIFSRVGIPREIHSDLGTQFKSDLMKELHRLLNIHPLFNTPYHPQGSGRIERLHSTLKSVLGKLCKQQPAEWHRFLIPTLFALREMPSDRTGYSAFELLYGRRVRGPITVLKELWENKTIANEQRTIYQYVLDLKARLSDCANIAAEAAEFSVHKYKQYFDAKAKDRELQVGEEVLVLLSDTHNKLLTSWRGPYEILEKRSKVNYLVREHGGSKVYHINLLKKYYRRPTNNTVNEVHVRPEVSTPFVLINNCVVDSCDPDSDEEEIFTIDSTPISVLNDISLDLSLNETQKSDITKLVTEYGDTFSNNPGCTDAIVHKIKVLSKTSVRPKMYPTPVHLRETFEKEVDLLLEMGIIRPSDSPHCSPSLLVKKDDGTYRLAMDYRGINAITEFDAEPAPNLEEELHRFADAKYFSQMDLCKAYYQVPMDSGSVEYTAFATHKGLMEFVRMPFGLVTACSTYMKLMRRVLNGVANVSFYFDNILVFSRTWPEHLVTLREVFQRLIRFNLTVKPSKCSFGGQFVEYLGFELGNGKLKPRNDRLRGIQNFPLPQTKTQLRSFLGTCQFYSKFVPNFSVIATPLTNMLKKGIKEPLLWSKDAEIKFSKLKEALDSPPVLQLPDITKPFVVRTDASSCGLGAVLLQYWDGVPHPVAYASRKLLDRQTRYSTVERELLGVVFAVNKFKYYLLGQRFVLEVDHRPLVYLNKFKGDNPRLMRWALTLQAYDFRLVYLPGNDNIGADMLSRLTI